MKTDPRVMVYDISRHFITDRASVLGPEVTKLLLGKVRARDFRFLASCTESVPDALSNRGLYATLRQVEALFKKNDVFTDPVAAEDVAFSSFLKAERKCRRTNRRLDWYYLHTDRLDPELLFYLSKMKRWIDLVLGKHEDFLEELPRLVRLTAGATSTRSRRNSTPVQKVSMRPECTRGAAPYLHALANWFGYSKFKTAKFRTTAVATNRVEFVPKNWKTKRTIACEPEGNLPLQLAFDTYAKGRLRRHGFDLSDQSRNQRLACEASIGQHLATLDLSQASDTLAYNVVAWLLNQAWFDYLRAVRSPWGTIKREESRFNLVRYEKFSSMGNGTTFTLETLVFAAACKAVGSRECSVYGDDIILETELVPKVVRLLEFLGFSINQTKSFTAGPFRESCGKDWYEGVDITPFYLREWNDVKSTLCHNVNGLVPLSTSGGLLEAFLLTIVKEERLPLVPFNGDTRSGVFIPAHLAYSLGLLRTDVKRHMYCHVFKGYSLVVPKSPTEDYRSLFLTYLDMYKRSLVDDGASWQLQNLLDIQPPVVRSRTPAFDHKYVRKWVHWFVPVVATPLQLYSWGERVSA